MVKILFFGTPEFAVPSLQKLIERFEIVGLVCQPDKPAGRGQKLTPPATKLYAQSIGLQIFQPESKDEIVSIVERVKPDCVVVVAYGKILPPQVINYPAHGCINLHASLLPAYRGAAPIQRALMAGEKSTGNTVMLMDKGMDTGGILSWQVEPIFEEDNLKTLSERLSKRGAELLSKTLEDWIIGKLKPTPQDNSRATYAPPIQKEEYRICWKASAFSVRDRIRGLYPNSFAFTEGGERIKILSTKVLEACGEAGMVIDSKRLVVACGEGSVEILQLVSPKGKLLSGEDFMRGYRQKRLL